MASFSYISPTEHRWIRRERGQVIVDFEDFLSLTIAARQQTDGALL